MSDKTITVVCDLELTEDADKDISTKLIATISGTDVSITQSIALRPRHLKFLNSVSELIKETIKEAKQDE